MLLSNLCFVASFKYSMGVLGILVCSYKLMKGLELLYEFLFIFKNMLDYWKNLPHFYITIRVLRESKMLYVFICLCISFPFLIQTPLLKLKYRLK